MDKRINIEADLQKLFDAYGDACYHRRSDKYEIREQFVAALADHSPVTADGAALDFPKLPPSKMLVGIHLDSLHVLYTVEQMRQYAREAIAHYQRKQAGQKGGKA